MRIGIDMDDTTCSTTKKVIELEQDFSVGNKVSTVEDLWDAKRIRSVLSEIYKEVEDYINGKLSSEATHFKVVKYLEDFLRKEKKVNNQYT